jgi:adenosylhomocysteine nucleosidase
MTIGIICALPEEVATFVKDAADDPASAPDFAAVRIDGHDVVVASCGLGKVRAAMTATALIERWRCRGLVSAGTAGGLGSTAPMQVLVASALVQHDYGRSRSVGDIELYRPGVPPLPEYRSIDYELIVPAERLRRFQAVTEALDFVEYGTYASGDIFVNDQRTRAKLESLGALAVDMESAAVAQVADYYELPWLVAKGISDSASTMSHEDFLAGLAEASRLSSRVVAALLPALLED